MNNRHRHFRAAPVLAALTLALAAQGVAQTNDATAAPQWRTSWGHPDLQGTWSSDDVRGIPLQRPEELGTRAEQTDEEFAERQRGNDAQVARLREGGTAFLAERGVRSFRQTSLVVETRNMIGRTAIGLNGNGPPLTPSTTLVERFTRVADDRIDYSVTVTDPETYTAPFTIAFPITPQPDYQVLPYECHEGNLALANILSAARAEDRAIADARAKGLPEPKFNNDDGPIFAAPRE